MTAADLEAAWAVRQAFPDQDFSIVDRTSFAVMQRLGVYRAASFDDHFVVLRLGSGAQARVRDRPVAWGGITRRRDTGIGWMTGPPDDPST